MELWNYEIVELWNYSLSAVSLRDLTFISHSHFLLYI